MYAAEVITVAGFARKKAFILCYELFSVLRSTKSRVGFRVT